MTIYSSFSELIGRLECVVGESRGWGHFTNALWVHNSTLDSFFVIHLDFGDSFELHIFACHKHFCRHGMSRIAAQMIITFWMKAKFGYSIMQNFVTFEFWVHTSFIAPRFTAQMNNEFIIKILWKSLLLLKWSSQAQICTCHDSSAVTWPDHDISCNSCTNFY